VQGRLPAVSFEGAPLALNRPRQTKNQTRTARSARMSGGAPTGLNGPAILRRRDLGPFLSECVENFRTSRPSPALPIVDVTRRPAAPYLYSLPERPSILAARLGLLRRLALFGAGLAGALFLAERLMGLPLDADGWLVLFFAAMGALSWGLLQTRHFAGGAWMLVACLFGMTAVSAYFFGSVRTVDNALILVGQVAVGILLSRRALLWTTLGAVVYLGLLTWADASGWLGALPRFEVGMRTWLAQAACMAGIAVMMYLNRVQMQQAQQLPVQEAHQRLKAQVERDLELERFMRVFQSSPAPIYVLSAHTGAILDVNRAFERTMGHPRQALLGKRDGFLWLHDARQEAFSQQRRAVLRTDWHKVIGLCADGRQIPLEICSERDEDSADSLVITALRLPGNGVWGPLVGSGLPALEAGLD
jgi:PAS domain S-box-containing protein